MTRPATPVRDVVYVVTDPGVPAYGRKGASSHVQSVLHRLVAEIGSAGGTVTLVATRLGGATPPGLETVRTIELGRPATDSPAEKEVALVELDARAAQVVTDLVRQASAQRVGRTPPLVYMRYGLWSAAVLEQAREAGARTVLEVNAPLVDEQRTHRVLVDEPTATAMSVRALRAADVAYAVSAPVARWASDLAGVPVATIPNGVDVERFAPAPARQAGRIIAADGVPTIVFVGTFKPWHAPADLVAAAARLTADGDPVRLLLVGDGPLLTATVEAAHAAGVDTETTGSVDPDAIPGLLARADIACAPYPPGPAYFSPLKVYEYLGAGLPTVSAAVADLPDLIEPHEALLTPPGDVDALTDALRALVRDGDLRARLGAAARRAAVQRFSWQSVVESVLAAAATPSAVPAPTVGGAA